MYLIKKYTYIQISLIYFFLFLSVLSAPQSKKHKATSETSAAEDYPEEEYANDENEDDYESEEETLEVHRPFLPPVPVDAGGPIRTASGLTVEMPCKFLNRGTQMIVIDTIHKE